VKHFLFILLYMFAFSAQSAECSLYEQSHPAFLLDGSHLSTGKCNTCGSCHKSGVFTGTPKSCVTCHNGDPTRITVSRSAFHIPTFMVECNSCHNTLSFISPYNMNHTSVAAYRCDSCHNGAYKKYGADGKSKDHPTTTTIAGVKVPIAGWDCNHSGCHNTRTFSK
jgi:hypothetical protein